MPAAAPVAAEALKALLYGILAHLIAEMATDAIEGEGAGIPGKPRDVSPEAWLQVRRFFDDACDCTDDPEALEICRDRFIAGLEATLPRSKRRK